MATAAQVGGLAALGVPRSWADDVFPPGTSCRVVDAMAGPYPVRAQALRPGSGPGWSMRPEELIPLAGLSVADRPQRGGEPTCPHCGALLPGVPT